MARSDFRFSYPKRVRYSEIDAQAVVFNARYLDYLDIAMTEYLRAAGVPDPGGAEGLAQFVIARTTIDYKASIRLEEVVDLCVRLVRAGRTSLTFAFEFHGHGKGEDLRALGETVQVHIGADRAPSPLPDDYVALFERYEGRSLRA
ncbi:MULTISPECIES: acyl-CoA thioesterase [Edaphosphingomonas]|uniref:Acyl-CoA thioesterase n=3 Tax=Sphingomonadales TaxID=204457 RepID=A0A2T4HW81_9SPHN|nr:MULTISPECIES: thioesterase family protein [Sphingomonas]MDX3885634.1 thioesterase family protein [Sphingomonas sp.]OHT21130.1 acyl-CoA thioesterase YbgC [Sphingomonas haloaromaticamans]PTD20061.1 acyl-CoA thioesterase [Sphingomonas fennica]